jgi:hypothetical protein
MGIFGRIDRSVLVPTGVNQPALLPRSGGMTRALRLGEEVQALLRRGGGELIS